jgi:hypothetical protein
MSLGLRLQLEVLGLSQILGFALGLQLAGLLFASSIVRSLSWLMLMSQLREEGYVL